MATPEKRSEEKPGVSKLQLAIGAASLFLFIVGLKRTFRVEDHRGSPATDDGGSAGTDREAKSERAG